MIWNSPFLRVEVFPIAIFTPHFPACTFFGMGNLPVICLEERTFSPIADILDFPRTRLALAPFLKFFPVIVTATVLPRLDDVGVILVITGAGPGIGVGRGVGVCIGVGRGGRGLSVGVGAGAAVIVNVFEVG